MTLTFSLRLASGDLIDSTGSEPAVFCVGDGSLLPGFERVLFGMKAGEKEQWTLPPDSGFGPHLSENVRMLERSGFGNDIELSEGLIVSFADQQNTELPGVVKKIHGQQVEVDFNHPLAGREILFEAEILAVEQVSNEILRV